MMTLSSSSRQHRKSMLPTPRLSSRIGSRRTTSGETSRIARRVPSPMLASPASFVSGTSMHSSVSHPAASRSLAPPEFGTLRACFPSRIPSPSVQPSLPMPEQSELEVSSPASTPRVEGGFAEAPYPTPPASVEAKHERINDQEKVESFARHQNTGARGLAPRARHLPRRRESTALTSFSRTENSTLGDATSHSIAHKKLAMTSSVIGKENRCPPVRARVIVPATPAVVVPPPPIQPTTATLIPSSEMSPRPLVIKKKPPHPLMASPGQGLQAKLAAESAVVVPPGIKALVGDLDRFATEWTGMFDELYASTGRNEGVLSNASTRIHPTLESEAPRASQGDDLGEQTSNLESGRMVGAGGTRPSPDCGKVGKTTAVLLTPSMSAASIGTIHASNLVRADGETVHFDVSAASLVRWQHRDNTMLKDAPAAADMVPGPPAKTSASKSDSPTDTSTADHHSQKALLRGMPQPITPRAPRFIPLLPEINQSPIISGPRLVEMTSAKTSAVLSNRKDEITKSLEPIPTPTHGPEATWSKAGSRPYAPSTMAPVAHLSSSPASITTSLFSISIPHTSSPLAHQRPHDSLPQRTATYPASGAGPMRSTSLRGLRAIFKRTSAGLANEQRQRAESLKELIGEPRVLSLGNVSISNLRDAGIPGGGTVPAGPMDEAKNSDELVRKTTVTW
ncbi:hypothetical protein EDB83DRAFT_1563418 [Lactarius deliciosus]|nr:hypothetical protein EDB83DRAFT_1563418 [Lactarius deliciosus]